MTEKVCKLGQEPRAALKGDGLVGSDELRRYTHWKVPDKMTHKWQTGAAQEKQRCRREESSRSESWRRI